MGSGGKGGDDVNRDKSAYFPGARRFQVRAFSKLGVGTEGMLLLLLLMTMIGFEKRKSGTWLLIRDCFGPRVETKDWGRRVVGAELFYVGNRSAYVWEA